MQSLEFPHLLCCMVHVFGPCAPTTAPALEGLQPPRSAVPGFPHHLTAMLLSSAELRSPCVPFPRVEQEICQAGGAGRIGCSPSRTAPACHSNVLLPPRRSGFLQIVVYRGNTKHD